MMDTIDKGIKTAVGVSLAENRIDIVRIRSIESRLNLVGFSSVNCPQEKRTLPGTWRKELIKGLLDNLDSENETLRFCIPHRHTLTQKTSVRKSLVDNFPDWLEWEAKLLLPVNAKQEFAYESYLVRADDSGHNQYLSVIFPESAILGSSGGEDRASLKVRPLIDSMAIFNAAKYSGILGRMPLTILLNVDERFITFVIAKGAIFAETGTIEMKIDEDGSPRLDEVIHDLETLINFRFSDEFRPDCCQISIGGVVDWKSELVEYLVSGITPYVSLAKPFDEIDISAEIYDVGDYENSQHLYSAAFGAALSAYRNQSMLE